MEVDTHEVLYDKLTDIYVEIPKFDNQERKLYEDSVNAYRDIVNAIRTAEKKKFAEGMAKGETATPTSPNTPADTTKKDTVPPREPTVPHPRRH